MAATQKNKVVFLIKPGKTEEEEAGVARPPLRLACMWEIQSLLGKSCPGTNPAIWPSGSASWGVRERAGADLDLAGPRGHIQWGRARVPVTQTAGSAILPQVLCISRAPAAESFRLSYAFCSWELGRAVFPSTCPRCSVVNMGPPDWALLASDIFFPSLALLER